jgi:hypothetical protein
MNPVPMKTLYEYPSLPIVDGHFSASVDIHTSGIVKYFSTNSKSNTEIANVIIQIPTAIKAFFL